MPAIHTSTWRNLLSIASSLQGSGLVTEFNGILRGAGSEAFEIAANSRAVILGTDETSPYYLDIEQSGFYSASEYADIGRTRNYSLKFLDGGLVQYFCLFRNDRIARQRLCFYQSPVIRPYNSEQSGYDAWITSSTDSEDESRALFGHPHFEYRDVVSFRLDYAPEQYESVIHPQVHLHLNSFESCRIPVTGPVGVASFFRLLVKNFYAHAWTRVSPLLRDQGDVDLEDTIDGAEQGHVHFNSTREH